MADEPSVTPLVASALPTREGFIAHVGRRSLEAGRALADVGTWLPLLAIQMRRLGVDSVPIALFIAVFTGIVLSLLSSYIFTGAVPLYFVGAEILALVPLGPVFHGAGLNITVMSNAGMVHVGAIACRESVPDADGAMKAAMDAAQVAGHRAYALMPHTPGGRTVWKPVPRHAVARLRGTDFHVREFATGAVAIAAGGRHHQAAPGEHRAVDAVGKRLGHIVRDTAFRDDLGVAADLRRRLGAGDDGDDRRMAEGEA